MGLIEFKDVSFSFSGANNCVNILKNANVSIDEGESVALIGESGSGKSTFLNLIAGFLKPDEGEILVDGYNVPALSEGEACTFRNKTVGYVYQSFNLVTCFNALENVMTPLLIAGTPRKEAEEKALALLEDVGIKDRAKHFPHQMSGGEQQRVAIARALANNPSIILADEPTGNLDKGTTEEILDLLCSLNEKGVTFVIVTHSETVASRCSRVLRMGDLR